MEHTELTARERALLENRDEERLGAASASGTGRISSWPT